MRTPERWLVTGAGGMLGHDLVAALGDREVRDVTALGHKELDITDADAVAAAVAGHDIVVNAAAWTAVDDAEAREADAFAVNALGPAHLAAACARGGARLVQVSTDYVFSGTATTPYAEQAPVAPRSAYGRTKAAGEWAAQATLPDATYIVRTAWLYGAHGGNFVKTMIRLAGERDTVDVVADQRGQPTWSADVARQVVALVEAGAPPGIYHATSAGETTWYGLTQRIFELLGADPGRVRPTTTDRFPRPAPRPAFSVLGHSTWHAAGLAPIRAWQAALDQAFTPVRNET
jgi:dTDP-4-dehydrorhamnose reductase